MAEPEKIRNLVIILIAIAVVVLNGLIDHFFAPAGILLMPCIAPAAAGIISFVTKGINPIFKSILIFLCVSLNDIGIKLYGGGTHDLEGLGWVNLFFFAGLVPVYGILIATAFIDKQNFFWSKIGAIVLFPFLVAIHIHYFSNLGLGR